LRSPVHSHEVFLITGGSIQHHTNGECQQLSRGELVFVRPDDAHFFSKFGDENCKLINIAFLTATFERVVAFLALKSDVLLAPQFPPRLLLQVSEKTAFQGQMQKWGRLFYKDTGQSRQALRTLLANIISHFFLASTEPTSEPLPPWLAEVTETMRQSEHFIAGRDRLIQLSNRTPEYVGRVFKKYMNITPSQFVNDLRLNYAADLLLHTDMPPIEIAYDIGFGNLSHFYHLFKIRWGCSPSQFRKQHQQLLIP
jgi:AraC family transcriptional regulator, dual regulator of chb operon